MKLIIFISALFCVFSSAVHADMAEYARQGIGIAKEIVKTKLTTEWLNKLGKPFLEIAKFTKPYARFAGPAGEILVLILMFADENSSNEDMTNITSKLDAVSKQITDLDAKLTYSVQKIITESKLQNLNNILWNIKKFKINIESTIVGFNSNPEDFIKEIDEHLLRFRLDSHDYVIADILDSKVEMMSKSLIDDYIALSRTHQGGDKDLQFSTTQNVFNIYMIVIMNIIESNVVKEYSINLKTALTGNNYDGERRQNHYKYNEMLKLFFESLKKTYAKLNDNDLSVKLNLKPISKASEVRLINVLQIYLTSKFSLSNNLNCAQLQNKFFNQSNCFGNVRNCGNEYACYSVKLQLPQVDRIYELYRQNAVYGCDFRDAILFPCKCTCDQKHNNNSIRQIYTGKLLAPERFVVTGARFIEQNRKIYPQIEVGKLLPLGMIDQSSVFWLDPPTDDDFYGFYFDTRQMSFGYLKDMKFTDAAVIGIQLKKKSAGIVWTVYGREVDFYSGILGAQKVVESDDSGKLFDMHEKIPGVSSSLNFYIRNITKVVFSTSSESEDGGQSFVPYFDGSAVTLDTKVPLSGISLIQYTNDHTYAGYIRPDISTLDYRYVFKAEYQPDEYVPVNFTELFEVQIGKLQNSTTN